MSEEYQSMAHVISNATKTLVDISKHLGVYDNDTGYSVYIENRFIDNSTAFHGVLNIKHSNGNAKFKELGPFLTETAVIGSIKKELREMIDRSNLEIFNSTRKILLYPSWLV